MNKTMLFLAPVLAGFVFLTLGGFSQSDIYAKGPKVGEQAPIFEGTTLDNQEFNLKELEGKLVLVDFWFTTCPPCQQEIPHLKKVYKEYKDKGLEIVSIDGVEEKETIENFVKKHELNWIQLYDPQGKIHQKYSVQAFPSPFLIGPDGKVLAKGMQLRMQNLENTIKQHIDKVSDKFKTSKS